MNLHVFGLWMGAGAQNPTWNLLLELQQHAAAPVFPTEKPESLNKNHPHAH